MSADDRNDIDVGSWLSTLARYWWIVGAFLVLGIVAGGVVTLASPKTYTATSSVYIGQTTDANGNPMASLNSNVKAATELLASQAVLDEAAKRTGMGIEVSNLRAGLTVVTPSQVIKQTTSIVNIVVISVTDTNKVRATVAANRLADVLVERISGGADQKIAMLQKQLVAGKLAMASSLARSKAAQASISAIARGSGSAAEKAAAAAPYVAVAQAAASDQATLYTDNQKTELMLSTAQQVEKPRVLHEAAVPDSPSGPSLPLNVAAGALAGLVIGVVVAFVWGRRHQV